jgi:hypothetical protein
MFDSIKQSWCLRSMLVIVNPSIMFEHWETVRFKSINDLKFEQT